MANKLIQELKQTQNLQMTPQLQQAIKLLTLTHLEMTKLIAEEMVENPVLEEDYADFKEKKQLLEIDQKLQHLEKQNQELTADHYDRQEIITGAKEEFDWDQYVESYNSHSSQSHQSQQSQQLYEDHPSYENFISKEKTLAEHLEWQLRMQNLRDFEWNLAEQIIHNLNDDGYLDISLDDLTKQLNFDPEDALEILKMIQVLEPVGCGSRNLEECLLIQARNLIPRLPLVEILISQHLKDLDKNDYHSLTRKVGVSRSSIQEAKEIIKSFNPWPGRLISSERTQYIVPDIYVFDVGGKLVAGLNDEGVPRLKVSDIYKNMLKDDVKPINDSTQDYLQDKVRSAMWLIKSIQNRQKTILKVAEAIIKSQPEFFKKGASFLKPMILKDIAHEIGMHESTVSRVTSNKYMYTPLGLFELKYFFGSGIGGKNGGIDIAGESLKFKIKSLVDGENSKRPFSDQKIVELLNLQGVVVARRTVAKYREMMMIDSSARRKRKK